MRMLELNLHWITGVMLGMEFTSSDDWEEETNVSWGICIDLFIIRILVLFRKIG